MTTGQFFFLCFFFFFSSFLETKVDPWNFQGQRFDKNEDSFFVYGSRFPLLGCSVHCTLDHWDLPGCHFISIQAIFPRQRRALCMSPWVQQILSRSQSMKKKQNYTKSSWILKDWGFFFLIIHSDCWNKGGKKINKREQQCYIWVSHHQHSTCVKPQLSGTSLPAGVVGVSLLPAALAILSYADMTYWRTTQRGRRSTCAASISLGVNVGKWAGLKRQRAAAHPGPDLSAYNISWPGRERVNTLAEATVSNLTAKKKKKTTILSGTTLTNWWQKRQKCGRERISTRYLCTGLAVKAHVLGL